MNSTVRKFLEFNGKTIYFLAKDGVYWIAIKPICEALNVNYNRQFQNLKRSELFGQLFAKQQMVGADSRLRSMVCLPEKWIYGWIYKIDSASPELLAYQVECCEVLHAYFHGATTQRSKLLFDGFDESVRIASLEKELLNTDPRFAELQRLKGSRRQRAKLLAELDQSLIDGQLDLFRSD